MFEQWELENAVYVLAQILLTRLKISHLKIGKLLAENNPPKLIVNIKTHDKLPEDLTVEASQPFKFKTKFLNQIEQSLNYQLIITDEVAIKKLIQVANRQVCVWFNDHFGLSFEINHKKFKWQPSEKGIQFPIGEALKENLEECKAIIKFWWSRLNLSENELKRKRINFPGIQGTWIITDEYYEWTGFSSHEMRIWRAKEQFPRYELRLEYYSSPFNSDDEEFFKSKKDAESKPAMYDSHVNTLGKQD